LNSLANDLLRGKFAQMKDGNIRVVVVLIENGFFNNFYKKIKLDFFFSVVEILVAKEEQNVEGTFNEGNLISDISISYLFI